MTDYQGIVGILKYRMTDPPTPDAEASHQQQCILWLVVGHQPPQRTITGTTDPLAAKFF
jgi:hypothetical protein